MSRIRVAVSLSLAVAATAGDVWFAVPAAPSSTSGGVTVVHLGHTAAHPADVCPTFGRSGENASDVIGVCSAVASAASSRAPVPAPAAPASPAATPPAPDGAGVPPPAAAASVAVAPQSRLGGDGRLYKCCDSLDCSPSSLAYAGDCDVLRPDCSSVQCPPEELAFPPGVPQDPSCKTWKPVEEECKCGCYCICIYTSTAFGRRVKWLT